MERRNEKKGIRREVRTGSIKAQQDFTERLINLHETDRAKFKTVTTIRRTD